jgi:hypothetical protein
MRPDLPRLGDGAPLGETQPGVPPPGEPERFPGDPPKGQEDQGEAAQLDNGLLRIGDNRLIISMVNADFEKDGDEVVIRTSGGREHRFAGKTAERIVQQFARR